MFELSLKLKIKVCFEPPKTQEINNKHSLEWLKFILDGVFILILISDFQCFMLF